MTRLIHCKGNYGQLPRILFYLTIAAAVLLRSKHQWLYAGALVASLTYSGSAAIHACLLIWRGPAYGELDVYPLLGILSVSCIITVPLLNWSRSMRVAGRPDLRERFMTSEDRNPGSERKDEFDASARIIIASWSVMVFIGFLSVFVALLDQTPTGSYSQWEPVAYSGLRSLRCAPDSGFLNVTAGQAPVIKASDKPNALIEYNFFAVTQEFLDQNNCSNPCAAPRKEGVALFRTADDLRPLTLHQYFNVYGFQGSSTSQKHVNAVINSYAYTWSYIIVYILVEGLWIICFGRHSPVQIRTLLYEFFSRIGSSRRATAEPGSAQRMLSQSAGLIAYFWSVVIVLIAVPLLIVNMGVIEVYLSELPESEDAQHIGAWTPWASTGLALLAGLIAKLYGPVSRMAAESRGYIWELLRRVWPGRRHHKNFRHDALFTATGQARDIAGYMLPMLKNLPGFVFGYDYKDRIVHEWSGLREFCTNPEAALHQDRHSLAGRTEYDHVAEQQLGENNRKPSIAIQTWPLLTPSHKTDEAQQGTLPSDAIPMVATQTHISNLPRTHTV